MNLTIFPGHPLRGEVSLPGDKSLSHRAALFAALAEGESVIDNFLVSGVTRAMLDALTTLGVDWDLDGCRLTVQGKGWQHLNTPAGPLYCGNSATTLRLLAGALAASGRPAVLDGSVGLLNRPMGRIVEPLRAMGVDIQSAPGNRAPLRLSARPSGRRLQAGEHVLPVASAQVKTCLLLAALAADGPVTLREPSLSRDHTERMLSSMGVTIDRLAPEAGAGPGATLQPPASPLHPLVLSLPGDFSAAAFLIAAALITPGSEILLREVGLNPTRTGLLEALRAMGADIQVTPTADRAGEPAGDLVVRHSQLRGTTVSGDLGVRMIDEFPAFAAAASFARGRTEVSDAEELRHKESDRIAALCQELGRLGAAVIESPGGFSVQGNLLAGGQRVQPHGDHRLAMALALVGLAAREPVTVEGAEIIAESFPEFASVLAGLGAQVVPEGSAG